MAERRVKGMSERAGKSPRAHSLIEVGCTDWYIYPHVEPDANEGAAPTRGERAPRLTAKLAALTRRVEPGAGAWVKRPLTD